MKTHFQVGIMSTFYLTLLATWLQTLAANVIFRNSYTELLTAAGVLLLFYILYYAEGLELAVADLRDKDANQIGDPRTREVLGQMQRLSEFFFSQRQIFVVSIITFVSLALDYDALYFAPFGWFDDPRVRFGFSLSFVTLTVLWFCQVAPKRLAIINSELFLRQALFVWPLVRFIGHFGLVAPVEPIVHVFRNWFGYQHERRLALSFERFYTQAVERIGVAVDSLTVDVEVHPSGSTRIRRRFVMLCAHGAINQFGGIVQPGFSTSSVIRRADIRAFYVGTAPVREDLGDLYDQLDTLAFADAGDTAPIGSGDLSANLLGDRVKVEGIAPVDPSGAFGNWSLRVSTGLPEGAYGPSGEPLLAIIAFDVFTECAPGVLAATGEDAWVEPFDLPCRRFTLRVTSAGDELLPVLRETSVGLGDIRSPFPTEDRRVRDNLVTDAQGTTKSIMYPAQGAVYRTNIDFLRFPKERADQIVEPAEPADAPVSTN